LTKFAQAMPEEYRTDDVVTAYQTYYKKDKSGIATWKRREVPSFMKYAWYIMHKGRFLLETQYSSTQISIFAWYIMRSKQFGQLL